MEKPKEPACFQVKRGSLVYSALLKHPRKERSCPSQEKPLLKPDALTFKTFSSFPMVSLLQFLLSFLTLPSCTTPQPNSSSEPTAFQIICVARARQGVGLLTSLRSIKFSRPKEGGKPTPRVLALTAGATKPQLCPQMPFQLSRQDTLTSALSTLFPFWYLCLLFS